MYREVNAPAFQNAHAYEFAGVCIRPGDLVVDAGASEGFFTRYALQKGANVLAFEPVPITADCLARTFAYEIANNRVKVFKVALDAGAGWRRLDVAGDTLGSSFAEDGIEVPAMPLDEILRDTKVDFIKMDIEGAEVDALTGASRLIARNKPRLAIAVYHTLEGAKRVMQLITAIRADYAVKHRGIWARDGCEPRPFMVYAW